MKNNFYLIALALSLSLGCSKEKTSSLEFVKKDGSYIDEGVLPDYEGCNYLIENISWDVLQKLEEEQAEYQDQDEYLLDRYLILIAQAIHGYAGTFCGEGDRWDFFNSLTDESEEFILDELLGQYPDLEAHLINYFAIYGEDFNAARSTTLQGYTYMPALYLENKGYANFNLPAWIGAGVEFTSTDSITDFIPMREECEVPINDFYLGKVETDINGYDPIPDMVCVENPIFIVNWRLDPSKKSAVYLGDVSSYLGTDIDTILPTSPANAPNGCAAEDDERYYLDRANFAGLRYERSRKSEIYISYATQNAFSSGGTLSGNHECDKIDRIKKKNMGKTHTGINDVLRGFKEYPSLPFNAWQIKDY